MNSKTLLQVLEPLTHQGRMQQMVEIGKQSRENWEFASTLNQLAGGDFYQRYLALQSCYGSQNIGLINQSLSDSSGRIRSLALRLIVLFGDDNQLITGLQAIPIKQRSHLLKKLLKKRRYAVIERYLTDLAIANSEDFSKFLSFGSTAFVTNHIEVLLHCSSNDDWRRLARYHPTLTASTLQQQAEAITEFDRRLSYCVGAALPELAERCPKQALNLCRALLHTTSISQINLQVLVIKCWNEVAEIVLQSEDRADCDRLTQLADRENTQLAVRDRALQVLARRDNGDGIGVLLAAMEDDRARIAIYALRTAILAMSPNKAIALLQTIPDTKVTVAKEVIRLMGEFTTESAYQQLLAWHKKDLHRDVRVALLRAFWTHLERDETWVIFQQAAISTDSAISTMVTRIPSNSLSTPAQAKLLAILATLLQHPDPLVRIDVLRRCVSLPLADPMRQLQQPLLQRLTSAFPDESLTAAQAFFATYSSNDVEVVAATVQKILPDRRSLQTTIDALQREVQWRRNQLLPTIRAVLAILATDPLVSSLRWKLAIAALPLSELIDFAKSSAPMSPETLWYAVTEIRQLTNCYKLNDLITLETALIAQEDAGLRRLALAALLAQVEIDGWNQSRRLRLERYQNDPATFIAAKAQFIFPPFESEAASL
jgi:hypothetical protein